MMIRWGGDYLPQRYLVEKEQYETKSYMQI